ncbi:MAG TPA: winged helix-turn-helix domain-containing protein [Rhodanobacteraceae bacterium]|nr:winged helix-turn-helix domain-containing protein [Rhodanobacteraceae bacterium]
MIADRAPATAWRWNDYLLLPSQRRLLHRGASVDVEDRAFDLLVLLLRHADRALDRQEIIAAIWGRRPVSDVTLRQLVYKARRAVGDDGEHQATIRTLYGRSLQWVAPVERVPEVEWEAEPATRSASGQALMEPASSGAAAPLPPSIAIEPSRDVALARKRPDTGRPYLLAGGLIAALIIFAGVSAAVIGLQPRRRAVSRQRSKAAQVAPAPMAANGQVTIAVLPFLDTNPGQDELYFSDGLTEELINRLGRFPNLRVAARTSSFVFRNKPIDVRKAARALGVENILEGSVQSSGDRIRVRVALVSARNGYELWSDEYEPAAGDVLKVEDEIAEAVLKELHPNLDAHSLTLLRATQGRAGIDPAAHDDYLVGLQYLSRRNTADINRAIAYFKRAIHDDPDYADAWADVATGYAVLRDYDADAPPDTHYGDALAAADKAARLDPDSARAHAVLGMLHTRHWQWSRASAEFQRALQLDPNDATTHQWYAIYFWFVGDMQNGLRQMRTAHQLDPLSPIINTDLSRAMLYAGDVDGAIAQARVAVALAPRFELARLFLASALGSKGRYADAVREIRAGIALAPSPPALDDLAFLGYMEWQQGDRHAARVLLKEVEARARQHYVSGVALASIEWPLGEKDRAFANLDRAAADHDGLMMTVTGVRDDDWCSDARFDALLASMHLPLPAAHAHANH